MNKCFLELRDNIHHTSVDEKELIQLYNDVDIIVDPELDEHSTVDINNYLNDYILKCRVCGNLFPSTELLDDDSDCPICHQNSVDGFIFKGKLLSKENKQDDQDDSSEDRGDESHHYEPIKKTRSEQENNEKDNNYEIPEPTEEPIEIETGSETEDNIE